MKRIVARGAIYSFNQDPHCMRVTFPTGLARLLVVVAAMTIPLSAQVVTSLGSFDGANGQFPGYIGSQPIQAVDGNLYGVTASGGAHGEGTVFRLTPAGNLTAIYSFCREAHCADGQIPIGRLIQGSNGNLYGMTSFGGALNGGTIFAITSKGKFITLYSFPAGMDPEAGLVEAANGILYGTTTSGGGFGTVYQITKTGSLATLVTFDGTNGANPNFGSLIQGSNGDLYGMTQAGGSANSGTIYEVTPSGKLTTLYNFCAKTYPFCTDGSSPYGGLVQGANGNFYGTTEAGGANGVGTVFELTSGRQFKTLHSFNGNDGQYPEAALAQGTDGNFYGTTPSGGATGMGTIFQVTPSGTFTQIYAFCSQPACSDGDGPFGGAMQATNGQFYGTTLSGGTDNEGIIFSLSMGLGPFVEPLPTAGRVGAKVLILGNNLDQATSVTFNGTAASFTVVSNSAISATVPAGATSGFVQVVTPQVTLQSNVSFHIAP